MDVIPIQLVLSCVSHDNPRGDKEGESRETRCQHYDQRQHASGATPAADVNDNDDDHNLRVIGFITVWVEG